MKLPWQRDQPSKPAEDNRPKLIDIIADPLMFNGSVNMYRITMVFDRKSLVVGRMTSKEAADTLIAELKDGLLD